MRHVIWGQCLLFNGFWLAAGTQLLPLIGHWGYTARVVHTHATHWSVLITHPGIVSDSSHVIYIFPQWPPRQAEMCAASSVFTSYWKSSSHQNQCGSNSSWPTKRNDIRQENILRKMPDGDGGWYWLTQKSSKGWHWPRRVVSRHPGLLGLLTWRMRFAPSRYLGLDGVRIPSLSLSRIGYSESVHSYIPSSITWLRPVFWALGTSTRIFCLALFIDQNQEQSFSINCQDVTHQLIEIWDQLSMRRGISHSQELPDSHRLTADGW